MTVDKLHGPSSHCRSGQFRNDSPGLTPRTLRWTVSSEHLRVFVF